MAVGTEDYKRACAKAGDLVDRVTLLEAIETVYNLWKRDLSLGRKINFHSYYGLSILDLGVEGIFEHKQYRDALAAYFQPRALRKLAKIRQVKEILNKSHVEYVSYSKVQIRVNLDISLVFKSIKKIGHLKWKEVVEDYTVYHFGYGIITDQERHKARKQALQVLNQKRRTSRK